MFGHFEVSLRFLCFFLRLLRFLRFFFSFVVILEVLVLFVFLQGCGGLSFWLVRFVCFGFPSCVLILLGSSLLMDSFHP